MTRSAAVAFTPENRLSQILTAPDRTGFADHIGRAERAVGQLAPVLADGLTEQIRTLAALCRGTEAEVFEACREIGRSALAVVESARLAQRPAIAEAAEGVSEMIDALSSRGVWHTAALRVHADALIALSAASDTAASSASITQELRRLRRTIGAQRTA